MSLRNKLCTYIFLLSNVLVKCRVSNVALNSALHHCASIVVLDKALPTFFIQVVLVSEPLFAEVLDSVVVSVSQEVV